MVNRSIEERLGSWFPILKDELSKEYFQKLAGYIAKRRKEVEIYPTSDKVFRAFELTPPEKVKSIWVAQNPYHQWSGYTDAPIADGLCFSTSNEDRTPASLVKLQKAMEDDVYEGFRLQKDNDLSYLANQGILLLNSSLTVEKNNASSHLDIGWDKFIQCVIEKTNEFEIPLVYTSFGKPAEKLLNSVKLNEYHLIFNLEHPAYACRQEREMIYKDCFSLTNEFIEKHYGKQERIKWLI